MSAKKLQENNNSPMQKLLEADEVFTKLPKEGDIVKGKVIASSKKEVLLDISGMMTGIVRGKELFNESDEYGQLKEGDEVEATVLYLENELGMLELSFRYAGHQRTWAALNDFKLKNTTVTAKVLDANKGGLLVSVNNVPGFLPVSQLSPEYYPRIQGGDKNRILEKLKSYVKKTFAVKVLDVDEASEKLIVSEKAAWEETQKDLFAKYKVSDVVDGTVTAVTDFGVFVQFGENLEGLVHISELAWQRIDDPRELYKVGDKIKAEIINIDGSKIFLSSKKLQADPWAGVADKYKIDDIVKGKVLKVTPFGLFVELDKDIHGLAHVSELSNKTAINPDEIAKVGDELDFKIVSIEPNEHRLGLSLKSLKGEKKEEAASGKNEVKEETKPEKPKKEKKAKKKQIASESNSKKD